MTKRQSFLAAMKIQPAGKKLVWAPNFDYWLAVNKAQKTLPEKYENMSRNDIVRKIGGVIWNRAKTA